MRTLLVATLALLAAPLGPARAAELHFIVTDKPDDTEYAVFAPVFVARESTEVDGAAVRVTVEHARAMRVRATFAPVDGGGTWTRTTEAVTDEKPKKKKSKKPGKPRKGSFGSLMGSFGGGFQERDAAQYAPWRSGRKGAAVATAPAEVTTAAGQLVFDPLVLSSLVPWAPALAKAQADGKVPVSVSFLDPSTGSPGQAEARPTHVAALGPPEELKPAVVQAWKVEGLGRDPVRLYVDRDGTLVGVRLGTLYMLREGWAWKSERRSGGLGGIGRTR